MLKNSTKPLGNSRLEWQTLQEEKKAYVLRKQEDKEQIKAMLDYLEHKDWYDNVTYKDID